MTPERRYEILTATAGILSDKHRWGQHTMVQHPLVDRLMMRPPRMCLVAAISAAIHGVTPVIADGLLWDRETSEVHDYLWALTPGVTASPYDDPGRRLMTWNDRVNYDDVARLLAIATLETEYEMSSAGTENPQHERDDRQDHQQSPQHISLDTRAGGN